MLYSTFPSFVTPNPASSLLSIACERSHFTFTHTLTTGIIMLTLLSQAPNLWGLYRKFGIGFQFVIFPWRSPILLPPGEIM